VNSRGNDANAQQGSLTDTIVDAPVVSERG